MFGYCRQVLVSKAIIMINAICLLVVHMKNNLAISSVIKKKIGNHRPVLVRKVTMIAVVHSQGLRVKKF